jgi:hypothetical protein
VRTCICKKVVAEWGRQKLLVLLGRVMIRSCKADLALLPMLQEGEAGYTEIIKVHVTPGCVGSRHSCGVRCCKDK